MAENIRVLIEEEKVDKRIEELGKKISASDLYLKGKYFLYLRTGKENYCSGDH